MDCSWPAAPRLEAVICLAAGSTTNKSTHSVCRFVFWASDFATLFPSGASTLRHSKTRITNESWLRGKTGG